MLKKLFRFVALRREYQTNRLLMHEMMKRSAISNQTTTFDHQ